MKSRPAPISFSGSASRAGRSPRGLLATLLGFLLFAGSAGAEQVGRKQVHSVNAPVQDHHLFVGIDLFLREGNDSLPVRLIDQAGSLVENESGAVERRPETEGFVWRKTAKVAPVAVRIEKLKEERVYSAVANPAFERESQQANLLEYFTTRQSLADRELRYLEARIKNAETARAQGEHAPSAAELTAQTFENVSAATVDMQRFSTNVAMGKGGGDDGELYDGLVLEFEAMAPQTIAEVQAVVMVRVRDEKEQYQDFNYSAAVGTIGPTARDVRIVQFDLPPGFELLQSEIHLFSRGEEIPTNRSERHMPLSAADAREFLLQTHLAEHRGTSVPAAVAWSLAPEALRAAEDPTIYDHAVTVQLDETGGLIAIENDATAVVPGHVRSVLESLVYLPALEDGQAVAGTLTVNPRDYFSP